jgi:hypothetical protein
MNRFVRFLMPLVVVINNWSKNETFFKIIRKFELEVKTIYFGLKIYLRCVI